MGRLNTNLKIVKSDTDTAPDGAEWRGEYYNWSGVNKKVFVEKFENAELEPIIDPTTKGPMYKRGAGGVTLNSVMTRRVVKDEGEREFILDDAGNGIVRKQYNFRESPEEIARKEREARRKAALDRIADLAADNPEAFNAILAGDDEAEARPRAKKKDAA